MIFRKLKQLLYIDETLDKRDGKLYEGVALKVQEVNFFNRSTFPEYCLKFIAKEEWYQKLYRKVQPHFEKDHDIMFFNEDDKIMSQWTNTYKFCAHLIK